MKKWFVITAIVGTAFLGQGMARAQGVDAQDVHVDEAAETEAKVQALLRRGDSLRMAYDFRGAVACYREAIRTEPDTTRHPELEDRRFLGENGANMMKFVYKPVVIEKKKFSIDEFFLYYPMEDRSWREVPNVLDSLVGHPFAQALYAPEDDDTIFFSGEDENGVRNIYMTEDQDSIWTAPALLDEALVSASDEVYPMLSEDGGTLYFSSKGLFGMGGYDLYYSTWNRKKKSWDTPVNLGFPFSSPYDDFLYYDSPDGEYTLFASNRECSADSVYVYVIEHDSMPINVAVDDPRELRELMKLNPPSKAVAPVEAQPAVPENEDTRMYMVKITEVKELRDSIYLCEAAVDEARSKYAASDDVNERSELSSEISRLELLQPELQSRLEKVVGELQAIEMDFLYRGVVIDPDKLMADVEGKEEVPEEPKYTFVKRSMGGPLDIEVEVADKFDYTFMILPEGRFAADNELPSGIVYQIQIFSINRKATIRELKGLSPVFEHVSGSRHNHAVGLFRTYADVLSQLNTVRRAGFKEAFIVAFIDGKPISVASARAMEK
ncbi:MAG: hypothetical protein LUD72_12670 [Bacteroidales bacterium]|nr:hypothetical protein [Bacteroidales bacterium]